MIKVFAFIFITTIISVEFAGAEDTCSLTPDSGPCRAEMQRYGYYSELNECKIFAYGGCPGNDNAFESLEECEKACVK